MNEVANRCCSKQASLSVVLIAITAAFVAGRTRCMYFHLPSGTYITISQANNKCYNI